MRRCSSSKRPIRRTTTNRTKIIGIAGSTATRPRQGAVGLLFSNTTETSSRITYALIALRNWIREVRFTRHPPFAMSNTLDTLIVKYARQIVKSALLIRRIYSGELAKNAILNQAY